MTVLEYVEVGAAAIAIVARFALMYPRASKRARTVRSA